jgi:hypothetical protein
MSVRALHEGVRTAEIPIPYSERVGRSKLSVVRDGSIFLQSILWTILSYNPVRILGALGLAGAGFAALVGMALLINRLSGVTSLGPWGVAALSAGTVAGVGGISLFGLGATFNYLVSLFHRRPVRQGLFGKPLFDPPLEKRFHWIGGAMLVAGIILGAVSLALGLQGWSIVRLWLYQLGSAMFTLVGLQLVISWILIRVLDELSRREDLAAQDLNGA